MPGLFMRVARASSPCRQIADHHAAADTARRKLAPLDLATELLDALAHAAESEAVRPRARVAADAVVADRQLDAVGLEMQLLVPLLRQRLPVETS